MQKQILIVATRMNQLMIDFQQRAILELKLLETREMTVPNLTFNFDKIYNNLTDHFDQVGLQDTKAKFKSDLSNIGQKGFYNIQTRKL